MSDFRFSAAPLLAAPSWPLAVVSRLFGRCAPAFSLLLLGILSACQSPDSSTAQANPPPPIRPVTEASDPATAPTIPSFTLSIDGRTEPLGEVTLGKTPNGGFVFGFTGPQAHVEIFGDSNVRIAVGKYPILDTTSSVTITAGLPPRFDAEREDPALTGYFSDLSYGVRPSMVHDWGEGLQKPRGRKIGEVVFTRVSDNTADGSFQSYVYSYSLSDTHVEFEGRLQVLVRHKGHLLKGTFKNLPYGDVGKALDDLQEALKAAKDLPIITSE